MMDWFLGHIAESISWTRVREIVTSLFLSIHSAELRHSLIRRV